MKKWIALVLALTLALGLAACGQNKKEDSGDAVTYTVRLVDEAGNPITQGGVAQLCLDVCTPDMSNEAGVFSWEMPPAEYKVTFIKLPEGYTYATEATEFYFEPGAREMTIALKKV